MLSLSLSLPLEAPKTTFGLITSTGNKDQRRLDNFAEASDICVKVADKTSQDIVNTCLSPGSLLSVATANIEPLEGDKLLFKQELVFKGDVTVDSSFIIELRACVCQIVESGSATETLQANTVQGGCEELKDERT